MHYLLQLLLSVSTLTAGKKYCLKDDDCTELGDLYCIKSHCNRGICGCPKGEAAIFLGSKHKYGCVKGKNSTVISSIYNSRNIKIQYCS